MKYIVGDIFTWNYDKEEISTLIQIYYDWDGTKKYQLQSYLAGIEQYIKESYSEEELNKFIRDGILIHYPVNKQ
jgi:hypothetical protein